MALFQSRHALGQETAPVIYEAGCVGVAIFTYTFDKAFTAASDILELGMIPADTRIIAATLIGEGLGAITADVGVMSGDFGAKDATRTTGTQLFNDQSVNDTEGDATRKNCLSVAPSDKHRGLGVTLSGNVAAGASKKITLVVEYTAA